MSRFGQFEIVSDTVVTPAILGKVEIAKMPDNTGAPRPMKMGTIASPWRYDVAAKQALQ
jgi:hypothetical protein